MPYRIRTRDEHLQNDGSPKRILALDGGGLKGILTLGILSRVESVLRERHGDEKGFRLCHYFDLIAGTSTGSIIAAALAQGMTVPEVTELYMTLGNRVFEKSFFRQGVLRAKYDENRLTEELKKVYGAKTSLGSPDLKTGLLIVTKRLDSGSPWPLGNNPRGKYFGVRPGSAAIPNRDYPLWKVVRASTAAPFYFDPESIEILSVPGKKPAQGQFVDGGISPFNNPALQAFMYATMDGYRVGWPTGPHRLLLVSVGTGRRNPTMTPSKINAEHAVKSLVALMDDCSALMETMMQWMSSSPTARSIDRELGDLRHDLIAGAPLLTYLRYDAELEQEYLRDALALELEENEVESLSEMDAPDNMGVMKDIGERAGKAQVRDQDFPAPFDLVVTS